VNCEICGSEVGILDNSNSDFEEEEPEVSEENVASDVLSSEGAIFLCSHCGAFMKAEAQYCSICSLAVEPMEFEEYEVSGFDYGESKLNNSGALFLCESCGAFIKQDAEGCTICGTELTGEKAYEEEIAPEDVQPQATEGEQVKEFFSIERGAVQSTPISAEPEMVEPDEVPETLEDYEESEMVEPDEVPESFEDFEEPETVEEDEVPEMVEVDEIPDKPFVEEVTFENPATVAQIKTDPQVAEECKMLWYKKAIALKKLGRFNAALRSLNKALNVDPENEEFILEKADISYEIGKHEQAIKLYRHLLDMKPENITIWNKVGNAFLRMGFQKESEICYDRALSFDENNRVTIINKGYLLIKQERYDEAIEYAERILV
jgi:tetratricopeptide (TPR) repeat protein